MASMNIQSWFGVLLCIAILPSAHAGIDFPGYFLGAQSIYGPSWDPYNTTAAGDVLTDNRNAVKKLGLNQMKVRLAKGTTCKGYHLECGSDIDSLKTLSQQKDVAATFADPDILWYQIWLYSYSNVDFQKYDWTDEALAQEYQETKDWAVHILRTYENTGKVFMAGNWEGDWMLMGGSNCEGPDGKWNMTCDPTPEVINRMVLWGNVRQKAIDDARIDVNATNVYLLYYIEMNLGPEAVGGKPGVTNDVLPAVNPDLVSYSSYSATNAYATAGQKATDKEFHQVLDYVESKLKDKPLHVPFNFKKRLMIGEFGVHENKAPTDKKKKQFLARVAYGALSWGCPFVLYWEVLDNGSTIPIIPRSLEPGANYEFFQDYLIAAKSWFQNNPGSTWDERQNWATNYFKELC